ncbi:alkaline shock response membrane anchor protein AmaP [Jannaschia sp. R86511]|uniref:alkaline shock response membrane anchor protein AmaP n=1 Tax=Jannaschia sp. R86511 TaxID=3093853 RepID=UPI0036D36B84
MAATTTRPGRLNRTLLALLGLLLFAAGAATLAVSLGLVGVLAPNTPVLPAELRTYLIEQPWAPYAVAAVGILAVLLGVRWLLAQLPRRSSTGRFRIQDENGRGVTRVDADTVADALEADIRAYPGVSSARADITGSRLRPDVSLTLVVDPGTDIKALQERLRDHAQERMSRALGAETVTTHLLVNLSRSTHEDRVA